MGAPEPLTLRRRQAFLSNVATDLRCSPFGSGIFVAIGLAFGYTGMSSFTSDAPNTFGTLFCLAIATGVAVGSMFFLLRHFLRARGSYSIRMSSAGLEEQDGDNRVLRDWRWLSSFRDEQRFVVLVFGRGWGRQILIAEKEKLGGGLQILYELCAAHASKPIARLAGKLRGR